MNKENWEKEFDEKLSKSIEEMLDYGNETKDFHLKIKSFIHSLLKSQRQELIEEIEGMKPNKGEQMSFNLGYRQALKDLLTKLKNHGPL